MIYHTYKRWKYVFKFLCGSVLKTQSKIQFNPSGFKKMTSKCIRFYAVFDFFNRFTGFISDRFEFKLRGHPTYITCSKKILSYVSAQIDHIIPIKILSKG